MIKIRNIHKTFGENTICAASIWMSAKDKWWLS